MAFAGLAVAEGAPEAIGSGINRHRRVGQRLFKSFLNAGWNCKQRVLSLDHKVVDAPESHGGDFGQCWAA